jgi:hypothetical protein
VVWFKGFPGHASVKAGSNFENITKRSVSLNYETYWATEVVSADFKAEISIGLGLGFAKLRATAVPPFIRIPEQEVILAFLNYSVDLAVLLA